MTTTQINLTPSNMRKVHALASRTGKTEGQIVNEAVEKLDSPDDAAAFDRWRAAMSKVAGIWADRSDLPDFDEIRRSFDRDVWQE